MAGRTGLPPGDPARQAERRAARAALRTRNGLGVVHEGYGIRGGGAGGLPAPPPRRFGPRGATSASGGSLSERGRSALAAPYRAPAVPRLGAAPTAGRIGAGGHEPVLNQSAPGRGLRP